MFAHQGMRATHTDTPIIVIYKLKAQHIRTQYYKHNIIATMYDQNQFANH